MPSPSLQSVTTTETTIELKATRIEYRTSDPATGDFDWKAKIRCIA